MGIRNEAKALLLHDGKVLLNRNQCTRGGMYYGLSDGGIYYDLPGGGQNQYETLVEAVIRECAEETGYTVAVDRLAAIYLASEWIDIGKIMEVPLYPEIIRSQWQRIVQSDAVVNLGSDRIG